MLDISVAGKQKTITNISATARFTMKKLVTVRILGERYTTAITKQFPTKPTMKTRRYATQYTAVIAPLCLYINSSSIASNSDLFIVMFNLKGCLSSMCVANGSISGKTLFSGTNLVFITSIIEFDITSTKWFRAWSREWFLCRKWCRSPGCCVEKFWKSSVKSLNTLKGAIVTLSHSKLPLITSNLCK